MDASWIWTEPHSRRLKLKLTVQKEVGNGAVLQQAMVVTFVERNQQCDDCAAAFTNNTWTAVVQVRQRVDHKRTFFYLEQLILKHSAHSQCTNIQVCSNYAPTLTYADLEGLRCTARGSAPWLTRYPPWLKTLPSESLFDREHSRVASDYPLLYKRAFFHSTTIISSCTFNF